MLMYRKRELPRKNRFAGFSLIELVIVVVIVAVLASVALPSYQNSVRKGHRSDAKATLMDVAGRMEQFMLDRGRYTYDMSQLGYDSDPMVSDEGYYGVDASECAGGDAETCYMLTATPLDSSPVADDKQCTSFILAYTGAKTATGKLANECWR